MRRDCKKLINQFEEEFSERHPNHSSQLKAAEWIELNVLAKESKYPDPVFLAWKAGYMAGKKAR